MSLHFARTTLPVLGSLNSNVSVFSVTQLFLTFFIKCVYWVKNFSKKQFAIGCSIEVMLLQTLHETA